MSMLRRTYLAMWLFCGVFWLAMILLNSFTSPYDTSAEYASVWAAMHSAKRLIFPSALVLTPLLTMALLARLVMFSHLPRLEIVLGLGAVGCFSVNLLSFSSS